MGSNNVYCCCTSHAAHTFEVLSMLKDVSSLLLWSVITLIEPGSWKRSASLGSELECLMHRSSSKISLAWSRFPGTLPQEMMSGACGDRFGKRNARGNIVKVLPMWVQPN